MKVSTWCKFSNKIIYAAEKTLAPNAEKME
jgi:hypothetical protein